MQIKSSVKIDVNIYLEGANTLSTTDNYSAGIQKDNTDPIKLNIYNSPFNNGELGTLFASADKGAGIGSYGNSRFQAPCHQVYIYSGKINATSRLGAGIGGGYNISISNGIITASSTNGNGIGDGQNYNGDSRNIYISGGSVQGSIGDCTPSSNGFPVYLCKIPNVNNSNVTIDGTEWTSHNHSSVNPNDTTLYAWLTGGNHTITVGNECRSYSFNQDSSNFTRSKRSATASDFVFTPPSNLTYDGNPKEATVNPNTDITGMGNITVKYFSGDQSTNDCPVNAGTYTVKINVTQGDFYESSSDLTDDSWTFTIEPASISNADINIVKYSGIYNGIPHEVISSVKGCPDGSTIKYSTDNSTWKNTCPTITTVEDAAKTQVYIQISNPNYETWTSGPQTATISPQDITIHIKDLEKPYGTDNPTLTFEDFSSQLLGSDTIQSFGIQLTTEATTSSPVNSDGYPITLKSYEENSNYNVTVIPGTLRVKRATNTPNLPSNTTISVPWSCKKIGDISNPLPDNWNWEDTNTPNQALEVGQPITATAVYNGADKGNYVTETVTYTITRSECEHEHTAGRYYSSPSCTSSRYSGDTYCTDCNKTLYYGYTISAYGHDYDEGVITTEPTADTDGIAVYTCKRCKHQDTRTLGRLGDGEPYIDGTFLKKGWDSVSELIRTSKENDTISINPNGAETLPASVLSEIRGKDISLTLNMGNGFIWKISGTSVTAETPADMNLSVTRTSDQIPKALYELVSTNQNDFGFRLGTSGALDFPAVLSVKADSSCAGLMANLFWYDAKNGILQCIQTETVSGALERTTPYVDFTLSKGQDYFVVFSTESMTGRSIHTNGSITDENGAYLRPADANISGCTVSKNKLTVKLSSGCAGAQGYDFVISKKSNMLQTGKFTKTVSSKKAQAAFKYLSKGTWYTAARSWILDAQDNKVYGSWSAVKKIKVTVVTPQQPTIKKVTVKGNTVTITYTKCKNAVGYEVLIGSKYTTSADEKYPVKKYIKRTGNTTTVTFKNVKKGTWYIGMRSWNKSSKDNSRVYSPYSTIKKFKIKK